MTDKERRVLSSQNIEVGVEPAGSRTRPATVPTGKGGQAEGRLWARAALGFPVPEEI